MFSKYLFFSDFFLLHCEIRKYRLLFTGIRMLEHQVSFIAQKQHANLHGIPNMSGLGLIYVVKPHNCLDKHVRIWKMFQIWKKIAKSIMIPIYISKNISSQQTLVKGNGFDCAKRLWKVIFFKYFLYDPVLFR